MRIELRAIEQGDLEQLRNWRNSKALKDNFREYRLLNMLNQEDWFKSLTNNRSWLMYAITLEDQLIGACGLSSIDWVNRRAEIGLYIGDESTWGKGLGAEILESLHEIAFLELDLRMIYAHVYSYNEASLALFRKCGYTEVGRWRNEHFHAGLHWHTILFDLSNDEWKEQKC